MSREDQQAFEINDQCTAGQLLQIARHAQQLNHADIANKLRISEQYVKDLEADDFTHIGARIYVRGYLLSYAKLLGIPQEDMLQAMQASYLPEESMSMQRMLEREKPTINISLKPRGHYKRHFTRWFGVAIAVVLVAMIVVWWQSQKKQVDSSAELDNITHTATANATPQPVEQNVPLDASKNESSQTSKLTSTTTSAAKPAALMLGPANQTDKPAMVSTNLVTSPATSTTAQPAAVDAAIDTTNQPQTLPSNANKNSVVSTTPAQNSVVSPSATSMAPGAVSNDAAATTTQQSSTQSGTAANPQATPATTTQHKGTAKVRTTKYSKSARKRSHHYYRTSANARSSSTRNLSAALPEPGAT